MVKFIKRLPAGVAFLILLTICFTFANPLWLVHETARGFFAFVAVIGCFIAHASNHDLHWWN